MGGKEGMAVMDVTNGPHCPNLESGLVCDLLWQKGCCTGFELKPGQVLHSLSSSLGMLVPALMWTRPG